MKIHKIDQKTPEWLELRKGKVTGTGLKKIVGGVKTQESYFYEMLAERLTVSDGFDNESALDRGVRLEDEAREKFEKKSKVIVETVGFLQSDDDANIGCSPDGLIRKGKKYTEAVEIKCLSSGNHVRAWLTNSVPDEHMPQVVQAFIVNKDLQVMHVVFYDPRIKIHPLHIINIERKQITELVKEYTLAELAFLTKIDVAMAKIIKL